MITAERTRSLRDLAKSALSLYWAISLLSVNRAAGLLNGAQPRGNVLAPMTEVAIDQLDQFMKDIYRSGDDLQARIIDLAFSWVDPASWLQPEKWSSAIRGKASDEGMPPSSRLD